MTEAAWTHGLVADAELFRRMGATGFELGHLDDDPEVPRWWASVQWRGTREIEEDHDHPAKATRALAHRLLEGGQCVHCGKRTTVTTDERPATCRWHVEGEHWLRGCDGGWGPPKGKLSREQRRRQAKVKRLGGRR